MIARLSPEQTRTAAADWPYPLYQLTRAVASATAPAQVFEAALTALEQSIGVDRSSVLLFDHAGVMRFRAWRGLSDEYRAAVDGHSPWSPDTRDAAPVLVEDVLADPSLEELLPVFEKEGIRSLAFVPLGLGTQLLGKFMLYFREPHKFSENELLIALTVASHVAFAIDQQAHRETEARFRSLVGSLPALIVTTTPDGAIEDIDDAYMAYTGLTLEQAKDWEHHQMIHPDDFERAMEVWARAIETGEPMQNEMRLRRHDGVYRWYLVEGKPIRDEAGEIMRWVTVNVDIDDRKKAQARDQYLGEVTERLLGPASPQQMLAEVADMAVPALGDLCAIGLVQEDGASFHMEIALADESQRANVERVALRDWRIDAESSLTVGELTARGETWYVPDLSPDMLQATAPNEEQMQHARELGVRSIACLPLKARGRTFGIATFATMGGRQFGDADDVLLTEVASRLSAALENARLYDELQTTATELMSANAAKDEFLGLVSHELRTPLTCIRGNAEILMRRYGALDEENRQRALGDIADEGQRLERIVDNLLLLARLEQGNELAHEPLLVIRVVEDVVARHQRQIPDRRFEVHASSHARPVNFVEGYLDQVIENLVNNAEKYSPPKEAITIVVERSDEEVRVRVLDRGPGIDANTAAHLFQPFFRSARARASAAGLGIGLAVCKRLIEAQGGTIWARPRDGGGSEFGFALPVMEEAELSA